MRDLPGIDFGKEANPMKYCMKCGKANTDADSFCAFCGEKLYSGDKIRHTRTQEQAQQPEAAFDPEPIPEKPETRRPVYTDNGKWPKLSIVMLAIASAAALGFIIVYAVRMSGSSNYTISLMDIAVVAVFAIIPVEFLIVCLTRKNQSYLTAIPFIIEACFFALLLVEMVKSMQDYPTVKWDTMVLILMEMTALCIIGSAYILTKQRGIVMPIVFTGLWSAVVSYSINNAVGYFASYRYYSSQISNQANYPRYYEEIAISNKSAAVFWLLVSITVLCLCIGTAINLWTLYKDRNRAAAAETPAA